jgi:streptomycin 6-kinase
MNNSKQLELSERRLHCERHWSLQVVAPFEKSSERYVAAALTAGGGAVVLKVTKPGIDFDNQVMMLKEYNGQGASKLIDFDSRCGAMIMERLEPGTPLAGLVNAGQDEVATTIAANLMIELWRPAPLDNSFPTIADWSRGLSRIRGRYDGSTGPLPKDLVEKAESLFADLISSTRVPLLLHGDLHHYNILSAQRKPWLAIDPKGVIGDKAYELGPYLRNPSLQSKETLDRRVAQLADELTMDRKRILAWAFAEGVLSAWWSVEDGGQFPVETLEYCRRIEAIIA